MLFPDREGNVFYGKQRRTARPVPAFFGQGRAGWTHISHGWRRLRPARRQRSGQINAFAHTCHAVAGRRGRGARLRPAACAGPARCAPSSAICPRISAFMAACAPERPWTIWVRSRGWTPSPAARARRNCLSAWASTDRAQTHIRRFDTGMLRRLGVAQALIHDPRVLLLDEPTAGLAPRGTSPPALPAC